MITVRLHSGQVLQFPDGTPEAVIRAAAQEVLSGEADKKRAGGAGGTFDLSHVQRPSDTLDLSRVREEQQRPYTPTPTRESSPGIPNLENPTAIGRVEGGTPPRSAFRRAIDASAESGSVPFKVLATGLDVAGAIPEALGVAGATALETNVQVADAPRLPLMAAEALMRRAGRPLYEASGTRPPSESVVPDPMQRVREYTTGLRERAGDRLAEATQDLPTPIAAGMFHQATTAGMAADASNLIGGGVAKPFGAGGHALTELEQAAVAQSGRFAPRARTTIPEAIQQLDDDALYEAIRTSAPDHPQRPVLVAELEVRDAVAARRRERSLQSLPPPGAPPATVTEDLRRIPDFFRRVMTPPDDLPRRFDPAAERARAIENNWTATPDEGTALADEFLSIPERHGPYMPPPTFDELADDAMQRITAGRGETPGHMMDAPTPPASFADAEAAQMARIEDAERQAFLNPPGRAFDPMERGSVNIPGSAAPAPAPTPPVPATPPTPPTPPVPRSVAGLPPHLRTQLPEERVAEEMGWKLPSGDPHAVGPPIVTPDFQTNIVAQLGNDPELANYVVQRSDEVFRAIGPPQSWNTLEEMATRLGTTQDEFLSRASHWSVLAPEARLRMLYVIKGNEQDIAKLQSQLVAGTATDADKADLLRHINTREDLIKLGAQTGSAYARALNSLKMEARLALPESQLLRQQLYRQYSKQLDAEKPLMSALAQLDPTRPEELQAFLRAVNKPKWYEYAHEYWVSSILSAPTSHLRNLIGNSLNAVMENAVVRPVSAGFDAARGVPTAEREIFLRETPAAVVGLTQGIRTGVRRGLEVMRRGYDPIAMQGKLFPVRSAFARSQNRVVREVIGPVVTMPLRMLAASDALFKTMNYTAEIYAQAAHIATKEGGTDFAGRVAHLVNNPTDAMIDAADEFALKATFNDEASAVGRAIMGLRDLPGVSSANPGLQKGIETYRAGMGFILPFVKIADRLMVRGFEYTPLGAIPAIGARRAGNFAEAADYAARSSVGSVILAYAASLAMEGRLTAGAPTDEAEKAAFYGAHKQPWSVRTEDGEWIPFAGLQPIGTAFALAAAAWKGWEEHGESPSTEKLGHAAAQIGAYVTDQSYMDGLSKFMDAIGGSESERGRAFSDLATNTAWGFTPFSGLTRSIARTVDPRVIEAETIKDRLRQNIPGTSLGMEARLTPWGEDVVPVGGRLRSILPPGSVLLPSREIQRTPIADLWNEGAASTSGAGRGTVDTNFDTQLAQPEELAFQQWKAQFAPEDSGDDYDLRGAFRAGLSPDPMTGHWPDTYKKPNHPTFSDQSIYAADAPGLAGRWDPSGRYIPPREFDLDGELSRLGMPLGYVGKTIADKVGTSASRGQWKLSQSEWYTYQQTAGRATKLMLERLYAKPGYAELDVEAQRERTQQAIEAARKYARLVMVRQHRGHGIAGMNPTLGDINAASRY